MIETNISKYANETLRVRGSYDKLPDTGEIGDMIVIGDDLYIFTGDQYELIGKRELEPQKIVPRVCKSCGAPLKNGKCEYCGSQY